MTDYRLLSAIDELLDKKLEARLGPLEKRVKRIGVLLENNVIPSLNSIDRTQREAIKNFIVRFNGYNWN